MTKPKLAWHLHVIWITVKASYVTLAPLLYICTEPLKPLVLHRPLQICHCYITLHWGLLTLENAVMRIWRKEICLLKLGKKIV